MLNLIAVSYKNIGPFQDRLLSVFFNSGKMLIKAPIGSGKSFLFFDGPIYGLYKYSSRNILNSKSKDGYIKIICEVDHTLYFITRMIKKGKSKDTCESKLYTVEGKLPDFTEYAPLENDVDIEQLIKRYPGAKLEDIAFKNETDLQQNLQTFLPPREVIMNTIFLMQDSDNIFELTPLDRLTILKNVFNLMGIDEAKEVLADKKREIRYKIKATTDISRFNEKLKSGIKSYLLLFDSTKDMVKKEIDTEAYERYFEERGMVEEKVQIGDFSLKDFPLQWEGDLHDLIDKKKTEEQKIDHQMETIQKVIRETQGKVKEIQKKENDLTLSIDALQKKIDAIDMTKIEELKRQRQETITRQIDHERHIAKKAIWEYSKGSGIDIDAEDEEDISVAQAYLFVQELIHQGKKGSETIKNIQLQIANIELMEKNMIDKRETEKKHKREKIGDKENQIKKMMATLGELEKHIELQATFSCERIQEPCPFIKIINKKTFDQLEHQKDDIIAQQKALEEEMQSMQRDLGTWESNKPTNEGTGKKALDEERQQAETHIEQIKSILDEIAYKEIGKHYVEYMEEDKEAKRLERAILEMEEQSKQVGERKISIEREIVQKEEITKQREGELETISKKEEERKILGKQKEKMDSAMIRAIEKNHLAMKQCYYDMETLVNDFKEQQLESQKLAEQETMLGNLYTIFSKELLLLVLQDHLPILNDIINNYLAQVVDYQINLQLRNDAEKVELEARIIDTKGMRDTKSLSGGQRIILKLVWMLAISSYINSPILFLDETINNLDADTVGKVADMLEDFVKQRDMKLYTITHSQQIQEMDIWDKIIAIA